MNHSIATMKINHLMALAAATLAVAAPARAAVVSFSQGDLLMGFHVSGGVGVGQTYVVDIGSAASFRDASGSTTLSLGNIGADLTSIFGANWSTRSDLSWGIAGTSSNTASVNGDPARALYASQAQITVGDQGFAWVVDSSTNRASTSTRMQGMNNAFKTYQSTVNSAVAIVQGDSDNNGWRSYLTGGAAANTPGGIDFGAFSGIEGTPSQALNLYRVTDGNPGSLEGSFSIGSNGAVTFTAVPEAASSLLVGAGALLLAARRRRNA